MVARLAEPLTVGAQRLANRVLLAPMSGISDRPFRQLAEAFGAGAVISEMVASEELVRGSAEARLRAERAGHGPHIVQLVGREARWMAEAARIVADAGADIVDINMGCPARKVTGGYAGSALMRDLDHALRLIEATVTATPLPVTLKMRLGWDDATINAPALARCAEEAGVRLLTVHARTRCQFYDGAADWAAIRAVKDAVTIPVIANGDLVAVDDLGRMLALSGADGVMIGRGACGRPWLPGHMAIHAGGGTPRPPTGHRLFDLIARHYQAIIDHYGPPVGVRAARKHLGWYMDQMGPGAVPRALRGAILTEMRPPTVLRLLAGLFAADMGERAA